ncbi:MAG: hypothetical protein JW913_13550 [Chitinispirillaceae bacterium]|nr:hypothetical protein [Chitinispirillaceae bacterium]
MNRIAQKIQSTQVELIIPDYQSGCTVYMKDSYSAAELNLYFSAHEIQYIKYRDANGRLMPVAMLFYYY